ncbi:hypothetical protein DQ04_01041020 [Trypanosoma grayi]|uniref:hypothetical protein n=1 Tax=Trypanosoma grayi TaxID=71804 RepID=UPI0004F42CE2|nr:hypothetical protein DQ04_01041020 [Trypanosoma grayi]KEG13372.1 hypothetical protein DQ04_01041020 [Trypanosoma grayi]
MPRAARRRGGGGGGGEGSEAGILPQRVRPVPLRLFSTQLQMLPLLPQYAVRYERRQRRQRRAAKEGIVTVERRCIIPLRFCDVSVGNQLPSRAGARRSAEMRFNTVLWGMKDVCRLKFAELTPANSCFTFL